MAPAPAGFGRITHAVLPGDRCEFDNGRIVVEGVEEAVRRQIELTSRIARRNPAIGRGATKALSTFLDQTTIRAARPNRDFAEVSRHHHVDLRLAERQISMQIT